MNSGKFGSLLLIFFLFSIPVSSYQLNFSYKRMDGELIEFSTHEGDYLIVDVFATWCETCRLEMAHLLELYDLVGDQFTMLSLSVEPKDTLKLIKDFKNEFSAPWEFGLDHELSFLDRYAEPFPVSYLFDKNGNLLKIWKGITKPSEFLSDLDEYIDVPENYEDKNDFPMYINSLFSNPLFLFFLGFIILNVVILGLRRFNNIQAIHN